MMPHETREKSSFASDVLKLVSGTTLAQGMSILAAPLLARLYLPNAFGTLAVFVSVTTIAGVIACLRYELAIMLPEHDDDAASLLIVSLALVLVITGLSAIVVSGARTPIIRLLNTPELEPFLWLVPLAVLANGAFLALSYWNSRRKQFGRLSIAQVSRSVVTNSFQLGVGAIDQSQPVGLIGGNVLGTMIITAVLGGQVWRDDRRLLRCGLSWRGAFSGLIRYRKFPLYSTWTALLNTLAWQLPVILLSMYFSPLVVGFYALGNRVVRMPMTLIGSAVAQVFYQRSAEANVEGRLTLVVENVFRRLVSLGLFPALLLILIGQDLFIAVFGEQWAEAGIYTQILSIYQFFNFVASPLGQLFSVLERQEIALVTNIALFSSRVLALWWGGQTGDIKLTLFLFSLSGVIVYGAYSMWLLISAGVSLRRWGSIVSRWLFSSASFLGVCWLFCFALNLRSWSLLVVYAVGTIGYYGWVLAEDARLKSLVRLFRLRLLGRR